MVVYVCTEAKPFAQERFLTVKSSKKKAESYFREKYPHMRKAEEIPKVTNYYSQKDMNSPDAMILFIREEELD